MSEHRNIVVLGASYAGLSAAHYTLKHIVPSLPQNGPAYRVVLIGPASHFYWRNAGPRTVVSETLLPDSKCFAPIADGFKQYPGDRFSFIQGRATGVDPTARVVTFDHVSEDGGPPALLADKSRQPDTIPYHALVIATGTRAAITALSTHATAAETKASLGDIRAKLKTAKKVIIAGGGPAGVETGGEIGQFLNGKPGFFAPAKPKKPNARITIYTAQERLLPALRPALAKRAEKLLNRLGVEVVYNVKVESWEAEAEKTGKTTVHLSTGEALVCDVFIPATGNRPNASYLPASLLTPDGHVQTNGQTLRVDAAGPRVYALGDVGSYTRGGVMDIFDAVPVCMTNLKRDLLAAAEGRAEQASGPDRTFTANLKETQLVPVGRSKGVGAVFGWKLPSFMVWLIKGRDYMTGSMDAFVLGEKWKKESSWKPTDT